MTYETLGQSGLDYFPCSYEGSRLRFRGPRKQLRHEYVACLGGTETYGRFIETPFPALIEDKIGFETVNLGVVNAGPEAYLNEPGIIDLANRSEAIVLEITGAQNCSNRFYTVHPRRNDRFVHASDLMTTIFRDADFTEFHFTGHLLAELKQSAPDRFAMLVDELQSAWLGRMKTLLDKLTAPVTLLWMGENGPSDDMEATGRPQFITGSMIEQLRGMASDYAEVVFDPGPLRTEGMVFNPLEALAAGDLMGIDAHHHAARALTGPLSRHMPQT
ncbi:DUF6473 family protein [Cognatishimia sp. MH4019]|uniref:DUF6473 family protein n=1 Tax=Cognatishimia sp. MH4019 TaxID=2854030 RepID=UPI001CD35836|nr:DUF6473 family protein [Cognatishimia sp. MH4019]